MASLPVAAVGGRLTAIPAGTKIRKCKGHYCGCVRCRHLHSKWLIDPDIKLILEDQRDTSNLPPEIHARVDAIFNNIPKHEAALGLTHEGKDDQFISLTDSEAKEPILDLATATAGYAKTYVVPVGYHCHTQNGGDRLVLNGSTDCGTDDSCTLRVF